MSPLSIPTDIFKEIIDTVQDLGDVKSLRSLALTSHLFLRRSQYHLFAQHIVIKSDEMLNTFCEFLDAHPDRRPWVRSVTMSASGNTQSTSEFLSVVPTARLLTKLLNLYQWRIVWGIGRRNPISSISANSELQDLRHRARAITHLHLCETSFQSYADFARCILVFSCLRHLRCESVDFRSEDDGTATIWARERLVKELQLSHLTIHKMPDTAVQLLLESTQHTLQELVIDVVTHYALGDSESNLKLSTLVPRLSNLSSISLQAYCTGMMRSDIIIQLIVDIFHGLASNPNSLIIHIDFHLLDRGISEVLEYLQNHSDNLLKICHTLETFLPRFPRLQKIEFYHYLRRSLVTRHHWTSVRLEHYLPVLHKQGLVNITCLASPIQRHSDRVVALAVSPDSRWIASGSDDTTIILWDTLRGTAVLDWPTYSYPTTSLAFSRDSQHLASAGDDERVMVWRIDEHMPEARLVATLEGPDVFAWSLDGTILLALGYTNPGIVNIWNPSTDQVDYRSLERYPGYILMEPVFSPDGRWIASARAENSCYVWESMTGMLHTVLLGIIDLDDRTEATFDPAGQRIIIAFGDGRAGIWDVETGYQLAVLNGCTYILHPNVFSPDGTRVLTVSYDEIILWDLIRHGAPLSLHGYKHMIWKVCFSPDGRYLASASQDHTVKLWDASDGSCIRTFTEHDTVVTCVAFTPDGETLASGGADGLVCIRRLCDVCPEEFSGDV